MSHKYVSEMFDLVTCLSAGTSARNSSAHIHGSSTIIIIIGLFVVLFLSLVIFISFGFNVTSEAPRLASLVYVRQQQVLVGKASKSL